MSLRILNKQPMKRNPDLHCVEFLDTNRKNIADIGLWCDINNILNDRLKYTAFNAEITVVCTEAATDVNTSEWGMQDEGRASYDANTIADEVRKALA